MRLLIASAYRFRPFLRLFSVPIADGLIEYEFRWPSKRSQDITTPTLIRAAWALVAARMTNSDDVVFGATVSGRNAPVDGIDEMVGPTIATVPVRIKLGRNQKVAEYLEAVQRQATEMIPFEQTGLHRIAKIPDCRQACDFQTLLVVQPQDDSSSDMLGCWQNGGQGQWLNTYPLTLELQLTETMVEATASFDSNRVESWIAQKILERLDFVMRQLDNADYNQIVSDIEIATYQDLEKIWKWNGTVPEPLYQCVHEMVEEKARAQPSAPAVCAWDGELTYMELDNLATRLAGRLIDLGIGPECTCATVL